MRRLLYPTFLACLLLLWPAATDAAPDRGSLTMEHVDLDGDGVISWNDQVTFTAYPSARGSTFGDVDLNCYQGWVSDRNPGTLVYTGGSLLSTVVPWVYGARLDTRGWPDETGATCRANGRWVDGRKSVDFGVTFFEVEP